MKATLIRKTAFCALLASALAGAAWAQSKPAAPADVPVMNINDQTGKEPGLIKSVPAPSAPRNKVEIYKQTLPNGQVVYGDAPVSGRKVDKVITVDVTPGAKVWSAEQDVQAPSAAPKPSYMTPSKPADATKAAEAARSAQNAARIAAEIEAAEEAFKTAEKELQEGKAPVDGDRSRNANGTTRLNEGYFARQKRLQEKMDAANDRLYQAYEAARTASR